MRLFEHREHFKIRKLSKFESLFLHRRETTIGSELISIITKRDTRWNSVPQTKFQNADQDENFREHAPNTLPTNYLFARSWNIGVGGPLTVRFVAYGIRKSMIFYKI